MRALSYFLLILCLGSPSFAEGVYLWPLESGYENPISPGSTEVNVTADYFWPNYPTAPEAQPPAQHVGVDFSAATGSEVVAIDDGEIIQFTRILDNGWTARVKVRHTTASGEPFIAVYGHCNLLNSIVPRPAHFTDSDEERHDLGISPDLPIAVSKGMPIGIIAPDQGTGHLHFGVNTSDSYHSFMLANELGQTTHGFGRIPVGEDESDAGKIGWHPPIDQLRPMRTGFLSKPENANDFGGGGRVVIQPGNEGKDHWTTSWFQLVPGEAPEGAGRGNGKDDKHLRVGGWGDYYHSFIQFDLASAPSDFSNVELRLFVKSIHKGFRSPEVHLGVVNEPWQETHGAWWGLRPSVSEQRSIGRPLPGWFSTDVTDTVSDWVSGVKVNHGFRLANLSDYRAYGASAVFYSSNYQENPALRPQLVFSGVPNSDQPRLSENILSLPEIELFLETANSTVSSLPPVRESSGVLCFPFATAHVGSEHVVSIFDETMGGWERFSSFTPSFPMWELRLPEGGVNSGAIIRTEVFSTDSASLDLKLPLPDGEWRVSTAVGESLPSHQGLNHHSLDFSPRDRSGAVRENVPILAAGDGLVVFATEADPDEYNGHYVVISHTYPFSETLGISTRYLHLRDQPLVETGDVVVAGKKIGYMGATGTDDVHLHFGTRMNNDGSAGVPELRELHIESKRLSEFTLDSWHASSNTLVD